MAHTTQFDKAQVETIAGKHDAMVTDVQQQLKTLAATMETTMAGASSNLTQALHQVYNAWSSNVQKVVLDNVSHMATAMRKESDNQEMADQDNTKSIMNTVSTGSTPMGSFLGG